MSMQVNLQINVIAFAIREEQLVVWVGKGSLLPDELLDDAARRIIQEQRGTSDYYMEQLYTFSHTRDNTVSVDVSYLALFPHGQSWSDQHDQEIVHYALKRLRWKVEYTNLMYSLLPDEFPMSQLQRAYEIVLGRPLDKRNFRKKILSLEIITQSGNKQTGFAARPAQMYRFAKKEPVLVKVFS